MTNVRDALRISQEEALQASEKDAPFALLGLSPQRFAFFIVLAVFIIHILMIFTRRLNRRFKARRERYLNSEAYFFNRFRKAAVKNDLRSTLNSLYRWVDELHLTEPILLYFTKTFVYDRLHEEVLSMERGFLKNELKMNTNLREWARARRKYIRSESFSKAPQPLTWINPG